MEIIRFVVNVGKVNGDFVVYVGLCVVVGIEMNLVVVSGKSVSVVPS